MSEEPMTDVKRYAPYRMLTREEGPHMFETMHGDWVRASDYDALKQEVERLVEALKQARGDYENKHDCENDTYEQGYIDGMEQAISIVNDWQTLDGKTKP